MSDPVEQSARAAARRLVTEHGAGLPADVEAALHQREAVRGPVQYLDPVSLGALVVSVASLAWTVYTDLKKKTPEPPREVVARTIRVRLDGADGLDPAKRDHIIEVVVDETVQNGQNTAG
jgi:hypothetical protein